LNELQASLPGNSAIFTAGTSVQGRTLTGIQIWGSGGRGSKPAILFHGTVHAREWIATKVRYYPICKLFNLYKADKAIKVTEYIAWKLITTYNSDATVRALLEKFDFYIIPVVNPDGKSPPTAGVF
jgi:murein tripeptide amidase MpaA